ncbi:hypothetical protein [Streptomyces sp. NBC_01669]|nr:hypothetical protein [Streptomyces sp. NBC_01669]
MLTAASAEQLDNPLQQLDQDAVRQAQPVDDPGVRDLRRVFIGLSCVRE